MKTIQITRRLDTIKETNSPNKAIESAKKLDNYLKNNSFLGYDPADVFASPVINPLKDTSISKVIANINKRSPINFRPVLAIKKGKLPKGLGLLLSSYSRVKDTKTASDIYDYLMKNQCTGYHGPCWGNYYDWQSSGTLIQKSVPNAISTSYVGHGILDYYDYTKNEDIIPIIKGISNFMCKDLKITQRKEGLCISYTTLKPDLVHNANVLVGSYLSRAARLLKDDDLADFAAKAMNFTINHQHKNGRWDYSIGLDDGKIDAQLDYHQGFILDCILWHLESNPSDDGKIHNSLIKGADFFKTLFKEDGTSYWRYPKYWPIDVHNQAQGIITFTRMKKYDDTYGILADKIIDWTLKYQQSDEGYFYYQNYKKFINKIPYMRLQAWMHYALSWYLHE